MNDTNADTNQSKVTGHAWPQKLNKVLIGMGVVAFGLIIADRLINMFQADDLPTVVEIERATPVQAASKDTKNATSSSPDTQVTIADSGEPLELADVFDSRLVFVSVSEPLYVVTENDRRIEVGDSIDEETSLAGITGGRVILEKNGSLIVVALPDPSR